MAERIRPRALPALAEAVFASEPQSQPNIDIDEAQRFLLAPSERGFRKYFKRRASRSERDVRPRNRRWFRSYGRIWPHRPECQG